MWYFSNDKSAPVITVKEQINSAIGNVVCIFPKTAVVCFVSKGVEYL